MPGTVGAEAMDIKLDEYFGCSVCKRQFRAPDMSTPGAVGTAAMDTKRDEYVGCGACKGQFRVPGKACRVLSGHAAPPSTNWNIFATQLQVRYDSNFSSAGSQPSIPPADGSIAWKIAQTSSVLIGSS